ncbi:cupin [Methanoculleus taiwanensis]|uniref:Cupin n=1 Tax=Methanoculleus taiwanensis TaxID=1550565 RepID=A0A498H380_9EURY|nr:cupin domain-containing protein [Methanoculleus taiwanensis]RXE56550.1 cupin [Methanoculleus taiwanensis]
MYRIALLLITCTLLSAGCLSPNPPAANERLELVTPADEISIFGGQATYMGLIGQETPEIPVNYSLGHVVIQPGNATSPHRLIGSVELVYLLSGEAEIRCDNETVRAGEGATVLLPEGVLQSIAAAGDTELHYITVIQPPFTDAVEVSGDALAALDTATDGVPIVVSDPRDGIEWDSGSGAVVYTLMNPILMRDIPIGYSLAYAELLPGGYLGYDRLNGSSDLIYVISGELEITTPDGEAVRVPAGSAAYIPPDQMKESRNTGTSVTTALSFVDPAWTAEKTALWE